MQRKYLQFFLAFLASTVLPFASAEEITASGRLEAKPYGSAIAKVVSATGLKVKMHFLPGERSHQMLKNGKVDAEFVRSANSVAIFADEVQLIGPIACLEIGVFKRASDPLKIREAKDLLPLRVGVPMPSSQAAAVAQANDIPVEKVMTTENLFNMLDHDRFDVVISGMTSGMLGVRQLGLERRIVPTSLVLHSEPLYFVLRNEKKLWAPRLQAAFDKAIQSGQWQKTIGGISKAAGLPANSSLSCLKARPQ